MITVTLERPEDSGPIETLLDCAFGSARQAKSSYAYRAGIAPIRSLCLVARDDRTVIGTFRCWPIGIGRARAPAVLVGPIAVAAARRDRGLGAALICHGLELARTEGHRLAVLVGDAPYYGRFGFVEAGRFGIAMARESPQRVLALPLAQDSSIPAGVLRKWPEARAFAAAAWGAQRRCAAG